MGHVTLALALFCFFANAEMLESQRISCSADSYACGDNAKCVKGKELCDFKKDCDDFSDESLSLCKEFHELRGPCRDPGHLFYFDMGCSDIIDICSPGYNSGPPKFRTLCEKVQYGLKPNEDFVGNKNEILILRQQISTLEEGQSSLKEVFEVMAQGFNESMCPEKNSDCPWLYRKINDKCVALFTVAKVNWSEAKQFCESVKGTLAIIDNMNDYEALLQHLRSQGLTTDFWIGGHYVDPKSPGTSGWKWLDERDIRMGVPYWSLYQNQNCTTMGEASPCHNYSLAPRVNRDGFCLALAYAFHFYFIDQNCHQKKSPICLLNKL